MFEAIRGLDDGKMPFAELCRRVGDVAEELGVQRPSYESIRLAAGRNRRRRRLENTASDIVRDVALYERDALDLLRHGAGVLPPPARRH